MENIIPRLLPIPALHIHMPWVECTEVIWGPNMRLFVDSIAQNSYGFTLDAHAQEGYGTCIILAVFY